MKEHHDKTIENNTQLRAQMTSRQLGTCLSSGFQKIEALNLSNRLPQNLIEALKGK